VTSADLELSQLEAIAGGTLKEARESAEREIIQQALNRHGGRITAAASDLGVSRPTLDEAQLADRH
jgi:transcriptional regulator with PAS, ATPase and Fis domain